jgi:hypothetical protein
VIRDLKELFAQASSPGDTATILLAGTAGFVVDAGLNIIGFLSPGYVGVTSASAALGLKKAWEGGRAAKRLRARAKKAVDRATALKDYLDGQGRTDLVIMLDQQLALHEAGVINAESLDQATDSVVVRLRSEAASSQPGSAAPPGPTAPPQP